MVFVMIYSVLYNGEFLKNSNEMGMFYMYVTLYQGQGPISLTFNI